jgi:transposase
MFEMGDKDQGVVLGVIKRGTSAREICRAHALNLRSKGYTAAEVADILEITPRTVINITNTYEEGGLERALKDDPRPGAVPKFDDRIKAKIVAVVCTDPPKGFDRWTLELLKERVQRDGIVESISKETIRVILQEHDLKPWQQDMWCIPELDAEYITRMESLLDVYELPYNPKQPVVCVDEKPVQLVADKRDPIPVKEGTNKKVDYEYVRNGSANVFCGVEPLKGAYFNKVTETKSGAEFAAFLSEIESSYPDAKKITLILDNFSSHTVKPLLETFGESEGQRIWNRFDVMYTPKHASWLNQAEIAIGMYSRQCLGGGRIGDLINLTKKTKAWNRYANRKRVIIQWNFTKEDARETMEYGEKFNLSDY